MVPNPVTCRNRGSWVLFPLFPSLMWSRSRYAPITAGRRHLNDITFSVTDNRHCPVQISTQQTTVMSLVALHHLPSWKSKMIVIAERSNDHLRNDSVEKSRGA